MLVAHGSGAPGCLQSVHPIAANLWVAAITGLLAWHARSCLHTSPARSPYKKGAHLIQLLFRCLPAIRTFLRHVAARIIVHMHVSFTPHSWRQLVLIYQCLALLLGPLVMICPKHKEMEQ